MGQWKDEMGHFFLGIVVLTWGINFGIVKSAFWDIFVGTKGSDESGSRSPWSTSISFRYAPSSSTPLPHKPTHRLIIEAFNRL